MTKQDISTINLYLEAIHLADAHLDKLQRFAQEISQENYTVNITAEKKVDRQAIVFKSANAFFNSILSGEPTTPQRTGLMLNIDALDEVTLLRVIDVLANNLRDKRRLAEDGLNKFGIKSFNI